MKILFTGGGTAGHIYPIIAIAREIKKIDKNGVFELYYIGPKDRFVATSFLREGIVVKTIMAGKMRRYFSFKNFVDIFKIPIGLLQAFFYIFVISPDVIFSKGGYGSLPVILAAKVLLAPIFLHESDVTPGVANKVAAKLALEIFVSFPIEKIEKLPPEKIISIGNIIRSEILNGSKEEAEKMFNLSGEKHVLLAIGGSQGAKIINDKILLILPHLLQSFELIHQTGENNYNEVSSESEVVIDQALKKYYHVQPFLNEEELANAYAAADIIITRAGAGSIFEIAAVGKPSILIPLSNSAQDHQVKNAYAYAQNGAAVVIEETNFTPNFFLERVKYLFDNPQMMLDMSKKAKEFARPEAAKIIAEYIVAYLNQETETEKK
jgi:UDP-N-acetylglucosamine--N-acetylmuramyl-(pentapeptide) pyrophosphoryl-undecaprenol N-acetylglucosamine transferase